MEKDAWERGDRHRPTALHLALSSRLALFSRTSTYLFMVSPRILKSPQGGAEGYVVFQAGSQDPQHRMVAGQ